MRATTESTTQFKGQSGTPQFMRAKQLGAMIGVSSSTIWKWRREGLIPDPIRPTAATSLFNVADVMAALAKLAGKKA